MRRSRFPAPLPGDGDSFFPTLQTRISPLGKERLALRGLHTIAPGCHAPPPLAGLGLPWEPGRRFSTVFQAAVTNGEETVIKISPVIRPGWEEALSDEAKALPCDSGNLRQED